MPPQLHALQIHIPVESVALQEQTRMILSHKRHATEMVQILVPMGQTPLRSSLDFRSAQFRHRKWIT